MYRCDGHTTERDVIVLPPGRDIVVAARDGEQRRTQAVVEADRTTVVDLGR